MEGLTPIPRRDGPRRLPHLPLKRVPARGKEMMVVTCQEVFEVYVHFIRGRTLPCISEGCPGCLGRKGRRREGYISGISFNNRQHRLWALTELCVDELAQQIAPGESLWGVGLTLERQGSRPNGPLMPLIEKKGLNIVSLSGVVDVQMHMARIWQIDGAFLGQDFEGYADAIRAFAATDRPAGEDEAGNLRGVDEGFPRKNATG